MSGGGSCLTCKSIQIAIDVDVSLKSVAARLDTFRTETTNDAPLQNRPPARHHHQLPARHHQQLPAQPAQPAQPAPRAPRRSHLPPRLLPVSTLSHATSPSLHPSLPSNLHHLHPPPISSLHYTLLSEVARHTPLQKNLSTRQLNFATSPVASVRACRQISTCSTRHSRVPRIIPESCLFWYSLLPRPVSTRQVRVRTHARVSAIAVDTHRVPVACVRACVRDQKYEVALTRALPSC